MVVSRGRRQRPAAPEARDYRFPKVTTKNGYVVTDVVIPNTGQGMEKAAAEARQLAAAKEAAAEAEAVPSAGDKFPNSGDSSVDEIPVLSPKRVDQTIREWLAANLPTTEQLFSASASLVGLQGIDQRVRDLVASFQEQLDGYRSDFTAWRDQVSQQWAALVDQANALMQGWRDQVEETGRWRQQQEAELKKFVSTLRGPQGKVGNTGMAGASTTLVDRLPKGKGVDFTRPFLERDAVVGDICIDGTTDMRYAWRWDGQQWERGGAMTSIQVRDVRVSALDASTKVHATIPPSAQSSEGSSPDTIKTRLVRMRVNERLAGLDRYDAAGFKDLADSALVSIELTALDGPLAGKTGTYLISLLQRPDGTCDETIYAEMGELADAGIAPDITIRSVGAYTKPASVTGTFPASATKHLVCLGWTEPTTGVAGRPNQVSIQGWCKWNYDDRVVSAAPAWKLSDEL